MISVKKTNYDVYDDYGQPDDYTAVDYDPLTDDQSYVNAIQKAQQQRGDDTDDR